MKNIISLILLAFLCVSPLRARHLTPQQALTRLKDTHSARALSLNGGSQLKMVAALPQLYVFSSGQGFVVASGNDCAPALIGYADQGEYNAASNPTMQWWLEQYSELIDFAQSEKRTLRRAEPTVAMPPIEPLCPFIWNQGGPYNDDCPLYHGRRCVTGCVATAMSILMRYHQWPLQGTGEHSYRWNDTTLTFNYAATRFDWESMPARYDAQSTEAQRQAVAQLMYAAGVGVNMWYHPGESAAEIGDIEPALRNYFNYSRSMWTPARNYYDLKEWNQLIYSELAAGRPVIYFGDGSDGGHEFICDGYSHDGLFHFNWGWGGISNGYFSLLDLDPPAIGIGGGDGGFDFQQHALLGVRPPLEGDTPHYLMEAPNGFVAEKTAYAVTDSLQFKGHYFNRSSIELPEGATYGLAVEPTSGATQTYVTAGSVAGLKPNHSVVGMKALLENLAQGEYKISPVYKPDSVWQRLPTPVNSNSSYVAVVTADSVFLTDPGVPRLTGGKIDMLTPLVYKHNFRCEMPLTNTGAGAFSGMIRPQLLTIDSLDVVANGAEMLIDVPADETINAHFDGGLTLNARYSTAEPPAALYVLRFINSGSHQQIGDTLHVTLAEPSGELAYTVSDFQIESGNPVLDADKVKFSAVVDCTSGYFTLPLQIAIYRKDGRREDQLRMFRTANVYIVEGQQATATATVDLSDLGIGEYEARAFVDHKAETDFLDFSIDDAAGTHAPVCNPEASRFFNLNGVPIRHPLPGVPYISAGQVRIDR